MSDTEITTEVTDTDDTEQTEAENTDWSEALDKVRREAKNLRDRLKVSEANADALARRLHTALVTANGKLADPADLAFELEHLEDDQSLAEAIESLIDAKPHMRRTPQGDVGQGVRGKDAPPKDFSGLFARTS